MAECFGCRKPYLFDRLGFADSSVDVSIRVGKESEKASIPYCESCVKVIRRLDRDVLLEGIEQHIESLIASRPKSKVSISEKLVREIALNLGASAKLQDALVERIFGKEWTGKCPDGARMNEYQNRDRLVAFVATKLRDLWTLEA